MVTDWFLSKLVSFELVTFARLALREWLKNQIFQQFYSDNVNY